MATNPYLEDRCPTTTGARLLPGRAATALTVGLFALCVAVALAATTPATVRPQATLTAASGAHVALAAPSVALTETMRVAGLPEGAPCDVSLELHALDDAGRDAGQVPATPTRVRARAHEGTLTVPVTLDASGLAGATVVALVRVEGPDGTLALEAQDITDAAQAVRLPSLEATLSDDRETADADAQASQATATVSFANLEPGVRHELTCALVDDETGRPVEGAGTTAVTFLSDARAGTRRLSLHLPARAGRRLRLAAYLRPVGGEVCARLGDAAPTIGVPVLAASSVATSTEAHGTEVEVTRTVRLEGLEAGRPHTLSSVATDADTGEELASPREGGARPSVELTPTEAYATASLTYALDAAALERRIAFADELTLDGRVLLRSDGAKEGTGAPLPRVRSTSTGAHTGMAAEPARADAAITCTLAYAGLEPGVAYEARGTLQVENEDGTGVGLASTGGAPVEARAGFEATEAGSVSLSYALDASALAGRRLRACERILHDGVVVAETLSQEVSVPALSVSARCAATGLREVEGTSDASVRCAVALEGMPEGEDLLVVVRLQDALTDRTATDAWGRAASATREVTATGGQGHVEVEVPVDASGVAGELVAVACVQAKGTEIASTADTWDEAARVRVPALTCTLEDGATGAASCAPASATSLLASVTCGGASEAPHSVELSLVDAQTGDPVTDALGTPVRQVLAIDTTGPIARVASTLAADTSALAGHAIALEARLMTSGTVTATSDRLDPASHVAVEGVRADGDATTGPDGDPGLLAASSDAKAQATDAGTVSGGDGDRSLEDRVTEEPEATGATGAPEAGNHGGDTTPATADATAGAATSLVGRILACLGLACAAAGALVGRVGRVGRGARGR